MKERTSQYRNTDTPPPWEPAIILKTKKYLQMKNICSNPSPPAGCGRRARWGRGWTWPRGWAAACPAHPPPPCSTPTQETCTGGGTRSRCQGQDVTKPLTRVVLSPPPVVPRLVMVSHQPPVSGSHSWPLVLQYYSIYSLLLHNLQRSDSLIPGYFLFKDFVSCNSVNISIVILHFNSKNACFNISVRNCNI